MQPKISVLVPVYNNEKYVKPCIESLLHQTLEQIEIICINDGSTDSTPEILHAFAARDFRVRVIDKINSGYGASLNQGFDLASGEYVTILESDDFADLDMLESLYSYAVAFNLDVVRANFNLYWSTKLRKDVPLILFPSYECDRVIDPNVRKDQHCFYVQPAIWSAIYKNDFIKKNNLRLLETPGAAYQDTAFNFKIWACAQRVMFIERPFIHYRQDNEASSINNKSKVDCICSEYHEIDRWLSEDRFDLRRSLAPVKNKMMCDAYAWNVGRVADEFKMDFIHTIGKELKDAFDADEIDASLFAPGQLELMKKTITDPRSYYVFITGGVDPDPVPRRYLRKIKTFFQVWNRQGWRAAFHVAKNKITDDDNLSDVQKYEQKWERDDEAE